MNIRTDIKAGAACYTVRSGDSLSTIAQDYYGGNASWNDVMRIYYSNRRTIGTDPNIIRAGQKLYIPDPA
jgi:nucleoid-associated protein YgaU